MDKKKNKSLSRIIKILGILIAVPLIVIASSIYLIGPIILFTLVCVGIVYIFFRGIPYYKSNRDKAFQNPWFLWGIVLVIGFIVLTVNGMISNSVNGY